MHDNLIQPNMVLQTCCYERTAVGRQNALNAYRINTRGSWSQEQNYWATMWRCFQHVLLSLLVPLFVSFFLSFPAFFRDVISQAKIENWDRVLLPWLKSWKKIIYSIYKELYSVFLIYSCPSESNVKVKTVPEMGDLQIFSCCCPTHFLLFSPLNSASVVRLPSFHPSIPWQHELPLCVTVTWASASPHITAAFDWPGLSRSVSCCLIITLFDCWSRDVIDWSAHPVWGRSSEVTCADVWVCAGVGVGWLSRGALDKHTCTHKPQPAQMQTHKHVPTHFGYCSLIHSVYQRWADEAESLKRFVF